MIIELLELEREAASHIRAIGQIILHGGTGNAAVLITARCKHAHRVISRWSLGIRPSHRIILIESQESS